MDEFISKPVDPRHLVDTVRAAVERAALPGIDMADAMARLGDNYDLLKLVYIDFRGQYGDGAAEMGQLLAAGAREDAAALAHTIKGVAGNIGAKRVAEAARVIEADLQAGGTAINGVEPLRVALAELSALAPAEAEPASATSLDSEQFARAVAWLRTLLTARDLDAEEGLTRLKTLCPDGPLRQILLPLQAAVESLDFESGLVVLADLERAGLGMVKV